MRILGCRRLDRQQRPSVVHRPPPPPSSPVDVLRQLPWLLRRLLRRVIVLGAIGSVRRASSGCPLRSRLPLRYHLMDLRTPAASASSALGDSAVDRFDRAAAFLRSAGTTAIRATGSFAGAAPQVGGVDEAGGELQGSSLFRSFGSVVNVNPGGFFGVEGQRIFGGEGQQPGSSGADGATILSSKGSWTLRSSSASLG